MDKLERMERMFNRHLNKIKAATTIQELINITQHDGKPIYTMKFFNKKFKGNFHKAQNYIITQAHIGFNNAVEAEMEGVYQ